MMPTIHVSGPYLREYPTILRELKRLHINLHDVRSVEIITGEIVFRDSKREPFGSMQFNPQATVILHTGESVELTGVTLEKCVPRLHNGHIGDGKTVRYKKKVWNEDIETYMPGIRLKSRNLTAEQALELLEWLEQERPELERKALEENAREDISAETAHAVLRPDKDLKELLAGMRQSEQNTGKDAG